MLVSVGYRLLFRFVLRFVACYGVERHLFILEYLVEY